LKIQILCCDKDSEKEFWGALDFRGTRPLILGIFLCILLGFMTGMDSFQWFEPGTPLNASMCCDHQSSLMCCMCQQQRLKWVFGSQAQARGSLPAPIQEIKTVVIFVLKHL